MSEFRQDIASGNWVLIAEGRAKRPSEFKEIPATPDNLPEVSSGCVFCPGNEKLTPPEIAIYSEAKNWQVRVVPNKYEALSHVIGKYNQEFYISRPGFGDHEVVVTRYHNKPLALQDEKLVDLTLQVYVDRINELKQHEAVRYVHIIQNHGVQAGGSIVHPHSQIFAIPFVPERVEEELSGTRKYFFAHGACVYCEMIMYEMKHEERVVMDDPDFLVITPYASRMPFEMHILPKKHRSSFNDITISERKALARVMKHIFSMLFERMHNPAYNYYIHTLPFSGIIESKLHDDSQSYHWHIVVLPRVNIWAGFELGTEVYVNIIPPEKAAKFFH